jgi:hypothetical protein
MPVMRYNRQLMMAILHDRVQIAKNVNVTVIGLDEALRSTAASRGQPGKSASSACIPGSHAACDVVIRLGVRGGLGQRQ